MDTVSCLKRLPDAAAFALVNWSSFSECWYVIALSWRDDDEAMEKLVGLYVRLATFADDGLRWQLMPCNSLDDDDVALAALRLPNPELEYVDA